MSRGGAEALAAALPKNVHLKELDLSCISTSDLDSFAKAFADALKTNTRLTHLDLSWDSIGVSGAQAFTEALETNRGLKKLNLWFNSEINPEKQKLNDAVKKVNQ